MSGALQAAETPSIIVILSATKELALRGPDLSGAARGTTRKRELM
jgi:hypothetical protein